ncbi:MAG: pyridoxal 5'-phosphate synthase glutaminase subunit PdxT [Candidatus Thermoplasmatota archaeon]
MVKITLTIGVLSVQGAISEHVQIMRKVIDDSSIHGDVIQIREKEDVDKIDSLIIPGGESTAISRMMLKLGIYERIIERVNDDSLPIMGTCAGCILLAKSITNNSGEVKSLNLMDMEVDRNAFGRQKESFESDIIFDDFKKPYHAVFIRAPVIKRVWGKCNILSTIDKKIIVAARQDNLLALAFHPELTRDTRIHQYFLDMISKLSL